MKLLTFDIEEWFHLDFRERDDFDKHWSQFESRIHQNMDNIFTVLDQYNHKATFFCVGWLARKYPDVIKRIDKAGHEVATHSDFHQPAYRLDRNEFRQDLERSIKSLEDITGKKIRAYRAPAFSITEKNKWVFEILVENGIEFDCSIFPAKRDFGGYENFVATEPCLIEYNGHFIKEFPMNFETILSKDIIFSGGGYFRLLPYSFIKKMTAKSPYVMAYFHPRDFDTGQPMMNDVSLWQKFKSYNGLKGAMQKFKFYLNDFEFIDLDTADQLVDWTTVPKINLTSNTTTNI